MKQKRYSEEFKKEAARLMIIDGLSGLEVSKKLGVHMTMLYRWKGEHLKELDGKSRPDGLGSSTEMANEIGRLGKQLAKSDRINEILKKRSATLPRRTDEV